ncbi:invasion associated locus B family protein [Polycladidibacter hongkongensis]|uniref:invasion associated locus B family protein n=1 Tax=Polycladidibacter hongkongensis TaxID=1647556 RepID=UPI000AEC79C2
MSGLSAVLRGAAQAIVALGFVVCVSGSAAAQGVLKNTFEDWQMRCDTPAGAKSEQCALIQNVTAEDQENVALSVIVLKTADKKATILRVLAPLGVLLPSQLGLYVDNQDIGSAPFLRCLPDGCVAEVFLKSDLLNTLIKGEMATFIIFKTPEEGIGIPISLGGFSAGYAALP